MSSTAGDKDRESRARRWLAHPTSFIADAFVLPNGRLYGEVMAPFQRALFTAIFARRPDGLPEHGLVYDERRRGESKTEDCAAAAVADLILTPKRHTSFACAGDEDQAKLIGDSIAGFKDRSPMLRELIIQRNSIIWPHTKAELRILSADAPSSYGVRPRKVFFDELSLQPDERLWTSMWSAIGKFADAQMIAVSMAGWDFASIGWKVHEWAAANPKWYFATRAGTEPAPWLSEEKLADQRSTLHPDEYRRMWECEWSETSGSWVSKGWYDAAEIGERALTGDPAFRYAVAIDVGIVHDPTALAVAHLDAEGRMVLDELLTMQGSHQEPVQLEAVEDVVTALTERFNVREVMFEAPQAVASAQRLAARLPGVKVTARAPTANTQADLFGGLYGAFRDNRIVLFKHDQLRREALALLTRTVAGRVRVVERAGVHQDHLVAVGIAAGLLRSRKHEPVDFSPGLGAVTATMVRSGDRPSPFGFGTTGRSPMRWSGGPDRSAGQAALPRSDEAERAANDLAADRALKRMRDNLRK